METILCVDTIAALKELSGPCLTGNVFVAGYYAVGDGGGGLFYWDAASSDSADGGTILQPNAGGIGRWKRNVDGRECEVRWFGAKGDAATDDTAAIRKAIDCSVRGARNASIIFGAGVFLYSDTIRIPPGNRGITLIGSRDEALQQGSQRPATVLRWTGSAVPLVPTFRIASTYTTFRDMAIENGGDASYFAEVEPTGAGRVHFYRVSCEAGASGPVSKPFSDGFLKFPNSNYDRIERCEFAAAAPVIVDVDGTEGRGRGYSTFFFVDNIVDSYFDTDVFRIKNCPFELLKIANNTFNAQPSAQFWTDLGFNYGGSGLTVVNSTAIDDVDGGYDFGNLIFRDNEYDDTSELPGARMLRLRNTRNAEICDNNIESNGTMTAVVELTSSVVTKCDGNIVYRTNGPFIRTLDDRSKLDDVQTYEDFRRMILGYSRVFFGPNTERQPSIPLINTDTVAGIVALKPRPNELVMPIRVPIFGNLGNPGGDTLYVFEVTDSQPHNVYFASPGDAEVPGYMTRGQRITVMIRNSTQGVVNVSFDAGQFKTGGAFTLPAPDKSRSISFVFDGAFMVELFRSAADVSN